MHYAIYRMVPFPVILNDLTQISKARSYADLFLKFDRWL